MDIPSKNKAQQDVLPTLPTHDMDIGLFLAALISSMLYSLTNG